MASEQLDDATTDADFFRQCYEAQVAQGRSMSSAIQYAQGRLDSRSGRTVKMEEESRPTHFDYVTRCRAARANIDADADSSVEFTTRVQGDLDEGPERVWHVLDSRLDYGGFYGSVKLSLEERWLSRSTQVETKLTRVDLTFHNIAEAALYVDLLSAVIEKARRTADRFGLTLAFTPTVPDPLAPLEQDPEIAGADLQHAGESVE